MFLMKNSNIMGKYFISKRYNVKVEPNDDGTLKLTDLREQSYGQPLQDAGLLIASCGGIQKFLELCISEDRYKEIKDFRDFRNTPEGKAQLEAQRAASAENQRLALEKRNKEREAEYNELLAKYQVIPSTVENIRIVLRYLNTKNWGGWELPKMTIGYTAHQYDCDGKQASAMKLDKLIDDGYDGVSDRFCVGAPRGYLNKYTRL